MPVCAVILHPNDGSAPLTTKDAYHRRGNVPVHSGTRLSAEKSGDIDAAVDQYVAARKKFMGSSATDGVRLHRLQFGVAIHWFGNIFLRSGGGPSVEALEAEVKEVAGVEPTTTLLLAGTLKAKQIQVRVKGSSEFPQVSVASFEGIPFSGVCVVPSSGVDFEASWGQYDHDPRGKFKPSQDAEDVRIAKQLASVYKEIKTNGKNFQQSAEPVGLFSNVSLVELRQYEVDGVTFGFQTAHLRAQFVRPSFASCRLSEEPRVTGTAEFSASDAEVSDRVKVVLELLKKVPSTNDLGGLEWEKSKQVSSTFTLPTSNGEVEDNFRGTPDGWKFERGKHMSSMFSFIDRTTVPTLLPLTAAQTKEVTKDFTATFNTKQQGPKLNVSFRVGPAMMPAFNDPNRILLSQVATPLPAIVHERLADTTTSVKGASLTFTFEGKQYRAISEKSFEEGPNVMCSLIEHHLPRTVINRPNSCRSLEVRLEVAPRPLGEVFPDEKVRDAILARMKSFKSELPALLGFDKDAPTTFDAWRSNTRKIEGTPFSHKVTKTHKNKRISYSEKLVVSEEGAMEEVARQCADSKSAKPLMDKISEALEVLNLIAPPSAGWTEFSHEFSESGKWIQSEAEQESKKSAKGAKSAKGSTPQFSPQETPVIEKGTYDVTGHVPFTLPANKSWNCVEFGESVGSFPGVIVSSASSLDEKWAKSKFSKLPWDSCSIIAHYDSAKEQALLDSIPDVSKTDAIVNQDDCIAVFPWKAAESGAQLAAPVDFKTTNFFVDIPSIGVLGVRPLIGADDIDLRSTMPFGDTLMGGTPLFVGSNLAGFVPHSAALRLKRQVLLLKNCFRPGKVFRKL